MLTHERIVDAIGLWRSLENHNSGSNNMGAVFWSEFFT